MTESVARQTGALVPALETVESPRGLDARLSIALCCAEEDLPHLLEALPTISALGATAFVVPGVDASNHVFEEAMQRGEGGGLLVLCSTDRISPACARGLASAFTRGRRPLQRFLVVELDRSRPATIAVAIRRALSSLRRSMGVPKPVSNPAMRLSDQDASVSGSMLCLPDDSPGLPDASASIVLEPRLRDAVGAIPEEIIFSAIERSRPLLRLVDDEETQAESAVTDLPTLELDPPSAEVDEASASGAEGRTAAIEIRPTASRWPIWAVGVGLATSALLMMMTGGESGQARVSVASPEFALRQLATAPSEDPRPVGQGPNAARHQPPTGASVSAATGGYGSAQGRTPAPEPVLRPGVSSRSASAPVPASDRLGAAEKTGATPLLALARAQGRVLVAPGLVATHPYKGSTAWHAAANRCRSRSVDSVRGWRLPKLKELNRLWKAGHVRDAVYWSSNRAARSDVPSNWALDGASGRSVKQPKEAQAQTICVRADPR